MKHNLTITLVVVALFLITQFIGLAVTDKYIDRPGKPSVELPLNIERPEFDQETSYIPVFIFILISTGLVLLLIHLKLFRIWKVGFFLSVWLCLVISFSAFVRQNIAIVIGLCLALLKVFRKSVIAHNLSEIFVYGALAALFVPIFNITSIVILLLLISLYDWIAVRKTKHMINLAKAQSEIKSFAGLLIPYKEGAAILGGGDVGFPLLFAGVVMKEFNFPLFSLYSLIVPLLVALALLILFVFGKKDEFYPAMPYLTTGCIAGLVILKLLP